MPNTVVKRRGPMTAAVPSPDIGSVILGVLSTLLGGGFVAYVGHSLYSGYRDHKKDVYEKLSKKRDKAECDSFRQAEKEARERVDDDLQQHKEEKR
jgi:hypothetical protein